MKEHKKSGIAKIYSKMLFRFIRMYILQLGFLDGYEGYLLAKYSSIYTMTSIQIKGAVFQNTGKGSSLIVTTYNWPQALEYA